MKAVWFCVASLIGSSLVAENVQNLEFHFPPSRYEWQPLLDENQHLFPDDDEDESAVGPEIKMKVFTHREGDALEWFVSAFTEKQEKSEIDEDDDEEGDEDRDESTIALEWVNSFLKNHQFRILSKEVIDGEEYVEWEFADGFQDLVHGYGRSIETDQGTYGLAYFTTALRNEYNRSIWMDVLSKATISE
jgi:hypothetical protein